MEEYTRSAENRGSKNQENLGKMEKNSNDYWNAQ